jgi:hypothetical protein
MAAAVDLTGLALTAFFGMCVPGVSQGHLHQTFPADQAVALTRKEKKLYAEAVKGTDQAYRIRTDGGLILMMTKGGFCRVVTAKGDADAASLQFRQRLETAKGSQLDTPPKAGWLQIAGTIPLSAGDAVSLVFTGRKDSDKGFFMSAFGVHKSQ